MKLQSSLVSSLLILAASGCAQITVDDDGATDKNVTLPDTSQGMGGSGAAAATGGSAAGGGTLIGADTGGSSTGGASATGGDAATGGSATGGDSATGGGTATGGTSGGSCESVSCDGVKHVLPESGEEACYAVTGISAGASLTGTGCVGTLDGSPVTFASGISVAGELKISGCSVNWAEWSCW